jgi:hypothetical protein
MADIKKAVFLEPSKTSGGPKKGGQKPTKGEKTPALAWNRLRLTIQPLTTVSIDTGIGGENLVAGEPPLGVTPSDTASDPFTSPTGGGTTSQLVPAPGTLPASRLMLIPLLPASNWLSISMPTEPLWNTTTQTAWITLVNTSDLLPLEINLLAWDPLRHSPGKADTYVSGAA